MNTSTNDQVLIKSKVDTKSKMIFLGIVVCAFVVFAILFLSMLSEEKGKTQLQWAFRGRDKYVIKLIITGFFFLVGVITGIIFWAISRCSLEVTEMNVKGKTLFGKEVVLPMHQVSAYSTGKVFSTIAVATSSGVTKFSLIGNYAQIGEVLGQKINEKQANSAMAAPTPAAAPQPNAMDDLIKLKALLDAGAITQEEFDAKKKQLLGL